MIRKTRNAKVLEGHFVLPTSARAHIHEPKRSSAFKEGQIMYLLVATQTVEEGGYPQQVVVSSDGEIDGWDVDSEVKTQHAQVRKNLPPRVVQAIVYPDGNIDGDISTAPKGLGLPHWEYINATDDGAASLQDCNAVEERIAANKKAAKDEKDAVRSAKNTRGGNGNASGDTDGNDGGTSGKRDGRHTANTAR